MPIRIKNPDSGDISCEIELPLKLKRPLPAKMNGQTRILSGWISRFALGGSLLLPSLFAFVAPSLGQENPGATEALTILSPRTKRGQGPLRDWLLAETGTALQQRRTVYEALKTPAQIVAHQRQLRARFIDSLGGFPERTPLNARVVGELRTEAFRIEKILFESQPGLVVSALLYLPLNAAGPLPVALMPCGHSASGKAAYQAPAALLATNGIAVFCFDPIGQGERRQLPLGLSLAPPGKPPSRYDPTVEHTTLSVGPILLGRNLATAMIWDGIRAIDYLETRPELDPKRIACVGNSGGGMMTSYLVALDERLAAGAIGCFMTTSARKNLSPGPGDAEQNIFAQYTYGLDLPDYLTLAAPRPVIILSGTRDYVPIEGAWEAFRDAKRLYARFGFPERVGLVETDAPHGFSLQLREGAARWLRRWLCHDDRPVVEASLPRFSPAELNCTPRGQVLALPGARSVLDLDRAESERLAPRRKAAWAKLNDTERRAVVRQVAGIPSLERITPARAVSRGEIRRDGIAIEKLELIVDHGLTLPALRFHPEHPSGRTALYFDPRGKQAGAAPGGPIYDLLAKGVDVLAVDLPGCGELAMDGWRTHPALVAGLNGAEAHLAYMLGKSLVGLRARDILVVARTFAQLTGASDAPDLIALGEAGIPALHAAAVEPELFASVHLTQVLDSWQRVFEPVVPEGQLESAIHGVLRSYDLPDLARLAGPLEVSAPLTVVGRPLKPVAKK